MDPPANGDADGARLFLPQRPLEQTRHLAARYGCDLAVPNDAGVGNILAYTRVVDDLAFALGRPVRLLTGPLRPAIGLVAGEEAFPLWRANPCVETIVDAERIDPSIMPAVNRERDNLCQFNHMIENIAYLYGVRPRCLRPSLYLEAEECRWGMAQLASLRRPVLCLHPHGTSSPRRGHAWFEEEWRSLIADLAGDVAVVEVGLLDREHKDLPTWKCHTTIRQMFALVWACDLFVGFDSSVAHVATAFQRPAAVLWDPFRKLEIEERWQAGFSPASLSRWAYPQNRNLVLLGDRDDTMRRILVNWVRESIRLVRA